MLWDSSCPKFTHPVQFPHMIFWTPEGLIKKLLIRKLTPNHHFWLTQSQLGLLDATELVETWPGESATLEDIDSESEGEEIDGDGDIPIDDDDFGKDDVKDEAGAAVMVTAIDAEGKQTVASEYIAGGGTLVISLQVKTHSQLIQIFPLRLFLSSFSLPSLSIFFAPNTPFFFHLYTPSHTIYTSSSSSSTFSS